MWMSTTLHCPTLNAIATIQDLASKHAHKNRQINVVDIGCYGWRLADACTANNVMLTSVDKSEPPHRPATAHFALSVEGEIKISDNHADVVIASHVLEHVAEPIAFFLELRRIIQPGGYVWLESPSEWSTQTQSSDNAEDHTFASFWDDPTHIRPWTPGSFYRLTLGCRMIPISICRSDADGIPSVRMLAKKPLVPHQDSYRYISFMGVEPGLQTAWQHVWDEPVPL